MRRPSDKTIADTTIADMDAVGTDTIDTDATGKSLSWFGIVRLGLVQTALGAIVVLTTTTINRVMVVELALPALLPGLLVGLHYAVQITRPRMGHGSDVGGRRTPWIVGGMAVLALGGSLAAVATLVTAATPWLGIPLAVLAFVLVGLGVGCSGTSLLVLLAKLVAPRYRGAAATTLWVMMIVGFIVTSVVAGKQLDPFSLERLVQVTSVVSAIAFAVTALAVFRIEPRSAHRSARPGARSGDDAPVPSYRESIAAVRAEPEARRFGTFVFVSMLAYSAQDLILEPFAGSVFGMTPGESTALGGSQNGGVLAGMLCVAFCTSLLRERFLGGALGSLRNWAVGGCVASAVALVALALGGQSAASFPLRPAVFALGFANGAFAVAAIGSMMDLVGRGGARREGVRMGFWGAAQALAFGLGGIAATGAVDAARRVLTSDASAYGLVFALQAVLFLVAAKLAIGIYRPAGAEVRPATFPAGRIALETDR